MKHLGYVLIMLVLAAGYLPVQAQNTAALTQSITSVSGRLTVHYPSGWAASNEVKADIQLGFASEALTLAENETTLNQANMKGAESGSLMIWALFSTLEIYPAHPNPPDFSEVFNAIFPGQPDVERLDIAGFPAARLNVVGESGFTLIGMGPAMLAAFTYARDQQGVETINAIVESLQVASFDETALFSASSLPQVLATPDQRVSLHTGTGWYFGSRGVVTLASPSPSPVQDFFANLMTWGPLEAPLFGVIAQPYAKFFELGYTPTEADLRSVLEQNLAQLQAIPLGDYTSLMVAGFPALQGEITLGDFNTGTAMIVDAGQTLYIVFGLVPSERLTELAPLVAAVFSSITITPLSAEIAALPPEGLREGFRAPQFTVTMLDGSVKSLSDFQGQVVMLNFWATWCPPCRIEMPVMQSIYEDYQAQGFTILAVNNAETVDVIQAYRDELGLRFPVVLDPVGRVQQQYEVFSYPTSIFVDRRGIIYGIHSGPIEQEQMIGFIEEGLARE